MSEYGRQMDDIALQLYRIAAALEVIANDITTRRERENAERLGTLAHLTAEARRCEAAFAASDAAIARMHGTVTDERRQYNREIEREMTQAWERLNAYRAAHPDLVDDDEAVTA